MSSITARLRAALPHMPMSSPMPQCIDAQLLFDRSDGTRSRKTNVYRIVIDGIDYCSDTQAVIRTDRLTGLQGEWLSIERWWTRLPAMTAALRDSTVDALSEYRFDLRLLFALETSGAGLRPLAGNHAGPWHAVVIGNEKIGIARPLKMTQPNWARGVIPGMPPLL